MAVEDTIHMLMALSGLRLIIGFYVDFNYMAHLTDADCAWLLIAMSVWQETILFI